VIFAVGRRDYWTAAEAKIRVLRVAERPAAARWPKREDGEGGCRDGPLRRGRRPRVAVVVCSGDGPLDLFNRHRLRGQETEHDESAARGAATAIPRV